MKVLLAEDERTIRVTLADELEDAGHTVVTAADGSEALEALARAPFDVVITDIRMPGVDGVELLKHVKTHTPETEVLLITGVPTYELAVESIKLGANDFIPKPFANEHVVLKLASVEEILRSRDELRRLRSERDRSYKFDNLIGRSPAMQRIFDDIRTVAGSSIPILLRGENGTGKELFAQAIHHNSDRADRAFVTVACHISNPNLIEDLLFGHVRGAYTGATEARTGKFIEADGGTIFLDDIDDMPLETQAKLLRVCEYGEVEPLGSSETRQVDVRILSSTKIELAELVEDGKFREDLYHRLRGLQIEIPPLRRRGDDIPLLVGHFLQKHGAGREYEITSDAWFALKRYLWPGNVRELEAAVRTTIALAGKGHELTKEHFARTLRATQSFKIDGVVSGAPLVTLEEARESAERGHIRRVLEHTGGNTTKAAEILAISRKSLWEKRKKYQIDS